MGNVDESEHASIRLSKLHGDTHQQSYAEFAMTKLIGVQGPVIRLTRPAMRVSRDLPQPASASGMSTPLMWYCRSP